MVSLVFLGIGFQLVANNSPDIELVEAETSPLDIHPACGNYTSVVAAFCTLTLQIALKHVTKLNDSTWS